VQRLWFELQRRPQCAKQAVQMTLDPSNAIRARGGRGKVVEALKECLGGGCAHPALIGQKAAFLFLHEERIDPPPV